MNYLRILNPTGREPTPTLTSDSVTLPEASLGDGDGPEASFGNGDGNRQSASLCLNNPPGDSGNGNG